MQHFDFLNAEWPDVHEAASKAESFVYPDARTACFQARRALELLVRWIFKFDTKLQLPYQDNLSALLYEPTFKQAAGQAVFAKTVLINKLGNQAVHGHKPIPQFDALTAVRELFHVAYWLAHTYAKGSKPAAGVAFNQHALPKTAPVPPQTAAQLQKLEADLHAKDENFPRCSRTKPRSTRSSSACAPKSPKPRKQIPRRLTRTSTPKRKRAIGSSICC